MRTPMRKLTLTKETIRLLNAEAEHVVGGMRIVDTSQTGTYAPTTSPRCADTSVSICVTNCGCKFG